MKTAFDAFRAVSKGESRSGVVHARDLPRIADRLADAGEVGAADDEIRWEIGGVRSQEGRPALSIALEGHVPLVCQRCMQPLDWAVEQVSEVLLARDEAELSALDDASEQEVVLANALLDPLQLVEDELLLTLPFVPRHDEECAPGA